MGERNYITGARPMSDCELYLLRREVAGYVIGGVLAVGTGVVAHIVNGQPITAYGPAILTGIYSVSSLAYGAVNRYIRKNIDDFVDLEQEINTKLFLRELRRG